MSGGYTVNPPVPINEMTESETGNANHCANHRTNDDTTGNAYDKETAIVRARVRTTAMTVACR